MNENTELLEKFERLQAEFHIDKKNLEFVDTASDEEKLN